MSTKILNKVKNNTDITHILFTDQKDIDKSKFITNDGYPRRIDINGNPIEITWDCLSTGIHTTYSIFSDELTKIHGEAVGEAVGSEHSVVLKRISLTKDFIID